MKDKTKCAVKKCTNDMVIKKHKLCWVHANQFYKTGVVKNSAPRTYKKHDPVKL